ncbi:MAG: glycosyltransferase [Desulfobacter sp.]|nr:MAG: glycosyltransferase [Desulfobacter sp.]
MKKKLLIINAKQFGYHIDTFSYCKYANKHFNISYLGFDSGEPKLNVDGVECIYILRKGNVLVRYFRFLFACLKICKRNYDAIFIKYFIGCALVKLYHKQKVFVFDIRSGYISGNKTINKTNDFILKFESRFFRYISVISKSLAEKMRLAKYKCHILPLGADPINARFSASDALNLLYVGTFDGRQIEDTIQGFSKFFKKYGGSIEMTYDIVGDGHNGELENLKQLVNKKGLNGIVRLPGYIHQNRLSSYFNRCNVGVSYIPITEMYDCQPPTKTFEYIIAGMPVIATNTKENAVIINEENGILIKDSAEGFYQGLKKLVRLKAEYDPPSIRKKALKNSWHRIVQDNFIPFIDDITDAKLSG